MYFLLLELTATRELEDDRSAGTVMLPPHKSHMVRRSGEGGMALVEFWPVTQQLWHTPVTAGPNRQVYAAAYCHNRWFALLGDNARTRTRG